MDAEGVSAPAAAALKRDNEGDPIVARPFPPSPPMQGKRVKRWRGWPNNLDDDADLAFPFSTRFVCYRSGGGVWNERSGAKGRPSFGGLGVHL